MTLTIASTCLTLIVVDAARAAPAEACGILFGTASRICRAVPALNVAAEPLRAFEIEPAALFAAHRLARGCGEQVVGWYHSHPNGVGTPSRADACGASEDGRLWLIAAAGTVTAWVARPGGPVHGRFEPVALVAA